MPQKEIVAEINWPPANAQEIARYSSTEALDKARAEEAARAAEQALIEDGAETPHSGKDS